MLFEGSRIAMNGLNPCIYKGLRRNENKKEEEDIKQQNPTMFQDLPVHGTMPSNQHKHWICGLFLSTQTLLTWLSLSLPIHDF